MQFSKMLLLLVGGAAAIAWAAPADLRVLEEIVAKVNGDIITRSELEKSRTNMLADLQQRGAKGPQLDQLMKEREKDILRDRIDQLLLVQKGKELSITVDAEISKNLADIQQQCAKTDPRCVDPDKFQSFVKEQTGMSYEDYKAEMRNSMLTQRVVRQEVGRLINIPRAEVEKYYNDHKTEFVRKDQIFLSEIFISTQGKDDAGKAAAEKKAKDMVARAKKGEKFGELARDNSDNPETARNGGEIGGQEKGDLSKLIVDATWEQAKGYVTDPPLKLDAGFLILKVDEHHKPGQADLEEVQSMINERLYMERFQPKIREYLTQLRADAFLEIKEGFVDASAAPGKNTTWTDPAQLRPETVTKDEVTNKARRKRLLWVMPIPGTKTQPKSTSK
ncbi:MAG: peptidylprolyl isomerase [Bryobacterales bacterium]|nr:peptidylprolyl isomerase [Bryobacterales bacterium]